MNYQKIIRDNEILAKKRHDQIRHLPGPPYAQEDEELLRRKEFSAKARQHFDRRNKFADHPLRDPATWPFPPMANVEVRGGRLLARPS